MALLKNPVSQAEEAYKNEIRRRDNEIRALGTEVEDLKKQRDILRKEQESLKAKVDDLKAKASSIEGELVDRRKEFDATQEKLRGVLNDKEAQLKQAGDAQAFKDKNLDERHQNASDREYQVEVKKKLLANILNKAVENVKATLDKEAEQLKAI